MRAIGTRTISFGLVSIPVKIYSTSRRSESISFRLLHGKCKTKLKQQYICPKDGDVVRRDEMVKGYEFARDQYVVFTDEEIKGLQEEATSSLAIKEFVPIEAVDPVYFDTPYYLGPDKGGDRAYHLLSMALKRTGLSAVAQYAARGKQYLVLLRPVEGGLVMQQLRYPREIRAFSEVPMPDLDEVSDVELNLALQLIEQSASDEFQMESYTDQVYLRMKETIDQKVQGEEIAVAPTEPVKTQVIDLMAALKASLAGGDDQADGAPARKPAKRSPRAPEKEEERASKG